MLKGVSVSIDTIVSLYIKLQPREAYRKFDPGRVPDWLLTLKPGIIACDHGAVLGRPQSSSSSSLSLSLSLIFIFFFFIFIFIFIFILIIAVIVFLSIIHISNLKNWCWGEQKSIRVKTNNQSRIMFRYFYLLLFPFKNKNARVR